MSELERVERLLAEVMRSADPVAAWERAVAGREDAPPLPDAQHDGLRLTALFTARLRFERLMQGSDEAREAYAHDPRAFTDTFRRYHASCGAGADPVEEAGRFARFLADER